MSYGFRPDDFRTELDAFERRLAGLSGNVADHGTSGVLDQALTELDVSLEELRAVEAELRRQSDELQEVRQALADEREMGQSLFDLTPNGCLITDMHGIIDRANQSALRMFRLSPSQLIGRPLASLIPADERSTFRLQLAAARHATRDDNLFEWEFRLESPRSSAVCDARLKAQVAFDVGDQPIALHWLIVDVTAELSAERVVRTLHAEFETESRNHAAELERMQRVYKELLDREQRARLDAEGRARQAEARVERLEKSGASNDRSLIEQGKSALSVDRIDLREVLIGALDGVRGQCRERKLELLVDLPREPAWMTGDALRLEQAFINLLLNAVKCTAAGGHIKLLASVEEATATVHVDDDGHGIAPHMLSKVFEVFEHGDHGGACEGPGIELALVKNIVDLHRGTVAAHSAGINLGSELIVRLPLEPAQDA